MNKLALAAAILITVSVFFIQQLAAKPPTENVSVSRVIDGDTFEILEPSAPENAFVTRVIDGDTFEIEDGVVVRILGINAPEKGQPLSEDAKNFLKSVVEGKNITMEKDVAERDKYGRLLRHVFINSVFVERKILENGLANAYIIPPSEKHSAQIKEAEQYAKENGIGLWKMDENYARCISISEFNRDVKGNDIENLNDEYVYLKNDCNIEVNMTGWTLKNSGRIIFKFGWFFLVANQTVEIYSGCGNNTKNKLFWCSKNPVWSNSGDTLYLRNSEGLLVMSNA